MPEIADEKSFLNLDDLKSKLAKTMASRSNTTKKNSLSSIGKKETPDPGPNYPRLVHSAGGCELVWSMQDRQFKLPKIQFFIQVGKWVW